MRLYLIRHPVPLIETGICYGSTDLIVLPDENQRALARLHNALPRNTTVYSSPLARCAVFAQLLAEELGCSTPVFDARLVEMNFGAWENHRWDGIARTEIDAWCNDRLAYRPGGGETVLEVAQRVHAFYHNLQQHDINEAIIVCHAGTIRMLQACVRHECVTDIGHDAFNNREALGYGELCIVDVL